MGIDDPFACYYFDRAVSVFGRTVERDVEEFQGKRKGANAQRMAGEMRMKMWLGTTPQFREPVFK